MEIDRDIFILLDKKQHVDLNIALTLKRELNAKIWRESQQKGKLTWNLWEFIRSDSSWDTSIYITEETFSMS